nr:lamin tail domain-containing protein [Comamonas testosteroni]
MHCPSPTIKGSAALPALLCAMLTACGGGGGGDSPSSASAATAAPAPAAAPAPSSSSSAPAPAPAASPDAGSLSFPSMPAPAGAPSGVFISEVANNVYSNSVSWLEIYNNSSAAIDLSRYSLRAPAINPATQEAAASVSFALPQLTVPNNSYVVIGARVNSNLQNGINNVYIANAQNQVPYWQGQTGFAELQSAGATVDFVRFGTSTEQPTTASAWSGPSVAAMSGSASSYNTSIVRSFARFKQTHTAGDWNLVNFATPGGINDVASGVIDSDGDGIPDSAKLSGGTYGGLDLYAMGARPGQRELFIHVDYLSSSDPGVTPDVRALDKIVQAFRKQNIAVHFDVGNLFSASFAPDQHNLSGASTHQRASQRCTQLVQPSQLASGCTSLYATKSANMDIRRKPVFRYLLMASSQQPGGQAGASGSAEMVGDDFLVTLGGWGLKSGSWLLANYQAATIMHELGHTLGLRHGGDEDEAAKPNYFSVMNYLYQISGLPSMTGSSVTQRYYYWLSNYQGKSVPGYSASQPFPESALDDGPETANFRIDYSNGSSLPMDENKLDESALIGRGQVAGSYADWNTNGAQDSATYAWDINNSGSKTLMRDYNDWANLVLNPRRLVNANNSGMVMPSSYKTGISSQGFDPVGMPFQTIHAQEHPLPMRIRQLQH